LAFKEQDGAILTDKEYQGSGGVYQWIYFKADEGKRDPSSYSKASLSCNGSPTCRFWPFKATRPFEGRDKGFQCRFMTSALVPVSFWSSAASLIHTKDNAWFKAFFQSTFKAAGSSTVLWSHFDAVAPSCEAVLSYFMHLFPA